MSKSRDELLKLIQDDPLGILETKVQSSVQSEDERLIASFEEINNFIDENGKEPEPNMANIKEYILYSRLNEFKKDEKKASQLIKHDKHSLFEKAGLKIESINDILDNDPLGILSSDADDIFTLKHVGERQQTDYTAKRKKHPNFKEYEGIFKKCHNELSDGKRQLAKFNESHLQEGRFFILNGVMAYLEKIYTLKKDKFDKLDGRTRIIFENGTYSTMKYRSFAKALTIEGKTVTTLDEEDFAAYQAVSDNDIETGYIYILKSLSKSPEILKIPHLYKIGYSRISVEERIKNAINEPTYLMAPVEIVQTFKCFNMNTQKFEHIIHSFLKAACVDIEFTDNNTKRRIPREWFSLPLDTIEKTIELIIDGTIQDYLYDHFSGKIIPKTS